RRPPAFVSHPRLQVRRARPQHHSRRRGRGDSERRADARRRDDVNGVVMKFGGTSVADAGAMTRVVDIVRRQWESQPKGSRPPVVVVSALSKVTDALIRATDAARAGDAEKTASILGEILGRHIGIALALTGHQRTETLVKALKAQTDELGTRLMQCAAKRVVTPADHDGVVAM